MPHHPCNADISEDVEQLIKRSGVDVESFKGKTLLITGGTGFFGIWFLSALASIHRTTEGGLRIIALSRAPQTFLQRHKLKDSLADVEFIRGDIKNFRLPPDVKVTHLVHMATTNAGETFAGEDQLNKLDMLYMGTRHVLETCGSSLESVLFTSSGVAYGLNHHELINETDFTAPDTTDNNSALGLGKLVAEYLVTHFAAKYGYHYSLARCFAFSGQYLPEDLHYALGNFVRNARNGKDIVIRGDGKAVRSYLYVGDAIAWLLRLLIEPKNRLFNVGSSRQVRIEGLARLISSLVNPPVGVVIQSMGNPQDNFHRSSYVPNNNEMVKAYPGIAEWTSLEESIERMLEFKE